MALRFVQDLSLRPTAEGGPEEVPTSEILVMGQRTGRTVRGVVLECAVAWNGSYLLFTTDNVPFEEALTIHLLDSEFREIDSAWIGAMYGTGTFGGARLVGSSEVDFEFLGEGTTWTVEILDQPAWRIPFWREAPFVWRPFGFSRCFKVRCDPKPGASAP